MTRKTTVCSDVKRTFFPETISYGDWWYEKILIWTANYKGYQFRATHRSYKENNGYDEYENLLQCTTTDDVVAENSSNFNQCIIDYVKWLNKKQRTKDIIIDMLLRTNLVYWYWDCKYFKYWWQYERCNYKTKLKFLKQDLKQLSLWELHKLLSYSNIKRAMKMCSWERIDYKWEIYYQSFHLDSNDEVIWEFMTDDDFDWDYQCDKHSPFYLLSRYNWMQF